MIVNVASKELCAKLKKLSGWSDTTFCWNGQIIPAFWPEEMRAHDVDSFPAYDLGYLLRRLPQGSSISRGTDKRYYAECPVPIGEMTLFGSTPEDAACKLVIELLKSKVIDKKAIL